jgi:hypothetical protein
VFALDVAAFIAIGLAVRRVMIEAGAQRPITPIAPPDNPIAQ